MLVTLTQHYTVRKKIQAHNLDKYSVYNTQTFLNEL